MGEKSIRDGLVMVPMDSYDRATMKLEGAHALVTLVGVLSSEVKQGFAPSNDLVACAMNGIAQLIEAAQADIAARPN